MVTGDSHNVVWVTFAVILLTIGLILIIATIVWPPDIKPTFARIGYILGIIFMLVGALTSWIKAKEIARQKEKKD